MPQLPTDIAPPPSLKTFSPVPPGERELLGFAYPLGAWKAVVWSSNPRP